MLYRFTDPKTVLKSVEILSGLKEPQALIFAPDGADASTLLGIKHHLQEKGYLTVPDAIDGQNVLRVERIGNRDDFLAELERSNYVAGKPQMVATPRDKALHRSTKEKIGENTKTAAGYVFTLGDGLLVGSGLLRKDYKEASAGALWGLTGLVLAAYGKRHPDTEMGLLYRKLDQHLKKEGIEFPQDDRQLIEACKRKDGIVQHINEFFTDNAADFHHVVQTLGGIQLARAGFGQNNGFKGAAGIMVASGQAMGLLPEKGPAEEHHPEAYDARIGAFAGDTAAALDADGPDALKKEKSKGATEGLPAEPDHRNPVKRTFDWFAEKPLRFSGLFPFVNNILNVTGAWFIERPRSQEIEKNYPGNLRTKEKQLSDLHVQRMALTTGGKEYVEKSKEISVVDEAIQKIKDAKRSTIGLSEKLPLIGGMNVKAWHLNMATSACYMVANLLYSMSPKNTPCDLDRVGGLDEIYAVAANVVTTQPKEFRGPLVNRFAQMFSQMPDIHATADEVASRLSAKVALIEHSPWAERVSTPAPTSAAALA